MVSKMVEQQAAEQRGRGWGRCQTCDSVGQVGRDLARTLVWQGGVGFVERVGCVNGAVCWVRWERREREKAATRRAGAEGMARMLAIS